MWSLQSHPVAQGLPVDKSPDEPILLAQTSNQSDLLTCEPILPVQTANQYLIGSRVAPVKLVHRSGDLL
jgi:hypothetical protein